MTDAMVQELLSREAIKTLKARYFRTLDIQDWDGFRAVFTDDVHVQTPGGTYDGGDVFVAAVREVLNGARTVHHGHTPALTIDGPHDAHGSWALADYLEWPPDPNTGARRGVKGYAYYDERYRNLDGGWRISRLHLRYLRLDPLRGVPFSDRLSG